MSNNYNIFISHSWSYGDDYEKLIKMLKERSYFSFTDYSVPKNDPIHTRGTDRELYHAIKNKIQLCHIVLIMTGKYATHSKWIEKEIHIAKTDFNKPVIGVRPWGSLQVSSIVRSNADEIVYWQSNSIVNAIRKHAL